MSDDTTPPDDPETPENGGEGSTSLPDGIELISIESELKSSYLDYAMSVIVSRALPDVRDGLKPVHRRILYAMNEGGNTPSKPYKKSANIVGAVMGNYHPHGDSAIYDALVRMAQPFSMGVTLVDGQGNFGSIDNDPPAAMRYTESRMTKEATYLLADIDKDTVDFQDNYDGSQKEPIVLPAQYPNLLVNGAGGIAVGMATNIPPHNLGEVIDATLAIIEDPTLDEDALLEIVPGPDFPTGGQIMGMSGSRKAMTTGRGSVYGCKPSPCIKVATNSPMYNWMEEDMDINAGTILDGTETVGEVGRRIYDKILAVAGGEKTKSELAGMGDEEFAPWMLGPTL